MLCRITPTRQRKNGRCRICFYSEKWTWRVGWYYEHPRLWPRSPVGIFCAFTDHPAVHSGCRRCSARCCLVSKAADLFAVLMLLVPVCFMVQVWIYGRRLSWTLSLALCMLFLTWTVSLCCGGTLFRYAGTLSPTPSKGLCPLTPTLWPHTFLFVGVCGRLVI